MMENYNKQEEHGGRDSSPQEEKPLSSETDAKIKMSPKSEVVRSSEVDAKCKKSSEIDAKCNKSSEVDMKSPEVSLKSDESDTVCGNEASQSCEIQNRDDIISQLMEMGFPFDEVLQALQGGNFDLPSAVENLLARVPDKILETNEEHLQGSDDNITNEIFAVHSQTNGRAQSADSAQEQVQRASSADDDDDDDDDDEEISPPQDTMYSDSDTNEDVQCNSDEDSGQSGHRSPPPELSSVPCEDRTQIERLVAMGFSADLATQVYFAYEKDFDKAAQFLMQNNRAL